MEIVRIKLDRKEEKNSINSQMLENIQHALDQAENEKNCKLVILEGLSDIFCSGLDFKEVLSWNQDRLKAEIWAKAYMKTLCKLASSSKVVVAKIEGKVIAGGTGLAAACDYVLAGQKAEFKLTEALWGLLPAMVTPFLIRRIGFQRAYEMTLTARTVGAEEALQWGLVDEAAEDPDRGVSELLRRISRLQNGAVENVKSYFSGFWHLDEKVKQKAIEETTRLIVSDSVQKHMQHFVNTQSVPWK